MRGSIEMNIIKQIASRGLVFVLAIAILGTGLVMTGDQNPAEAETLSSVYLTNKGTGYTTESSPPTARTAPSSRKNASTVYVTMTDVTTANAVKNSHLINANKVVVTVIEPDHNTKVAAISGVNDIADASATHATGMTPVVQGAAGSPVIDADGDGDLSDEISVQVCNNGQTPTWSGTAFGGTCAAGSAVWQIVSVANGDSATVSTSKPMVTIISNTAVAGGHGAGDLADGEDLFIGYYSSAVNTFEVKAWSTVQLEANASWISVVETGRNTGVFEGEFIVSDTEGVNDNTGKTAIFATQSAGDVHANAKPNCGMSGALSADVSDGSAADGKWDASGGVNADCEIKVLADNQDLAGSDIAVGVEGTIAGTYTLAAGEYLVDGDKDGSVLDSIYFVDDNAGGADILAANHGLLMNVTSIVCSAGDTTCKTPHTASRTMTIKVTPPAIVEHGVSDTADVFAEVGNNVVDAAKVDGDSSGTISNTVTAADLKSNRPGSDTISTGAGAALGSYAAGSTFTAVAGTGVQRTGIVEAQANATITVQYQDLTDNSASTTATTGTKQKATVTVDVSAPSPVVSSPSSGSSFKDRQPTFKGSVTDIGSGLDVSTATLYVDMLNDTLATGLTDVITTTNLAGSWLGGAGTINLQDRYDAMAVTLDNSTTMKDGVTSITWTVATSANIPCSTGTADGTAEAGIVNTGASTHTNFAGAISCNAALSTPDVVVDYMLSATDIAGNRGFSDSKTTDTDSVAVGDPYTLNIDELKPTLVAGSTQTATYYDAGSYAEKTNDSTRIRVAFDDEIGTASASSFEVTTDAGAVLTPSSVEIGPKGTNASGVAFDFRKNVYLTLPSALAANDTPKVKLVGDVADLAGNTTKSGNVANAIDKIKPSLTLTLSGGSGTGAAGTANDSDSLTKSAMTMTITTDEVLASPPSVLIFDETYGTGATYAQHGSDSDTDNLGAGASVQMTLSNQTIIDTDKDGSFTDELVLASGASEGVSAAHLVNIAITAASNSGDNALVTVKNNNSAALPNNSGDKLRISGNFNTGAGGVTASSTTVTQEGTVTAVAQDSKTYTATFSGSAFSDASTADSKAVVVSATDASTSPNTGTVGTRDQGSASVYKFRLDKTAPVLKNDPDGDGTVGSTTTLPRPYVIFEFTDNSNVTVVSASFGGDDVLASLATTNNKKYFMVPSADLSAKTYVVKAKGTDLAGNKGAEGSYNLKVTSRKDYKATILAGWNLMSFPSDPIANSVGSVFTNAGIDQVVGYDAMAKGSPWQVATKDAASGAFSGSLSSITSGNGYWVHSSEFSTQAVSLTGPEGPSASAPPSIPAIDLASGWNLVGVVDATKAKTQANEGDVLKTFKLYLGEDGGSSVTKAYEYNTSDLSWVSIDVDATGDTTDAKNANIGEAYWVFAKPGASGLLTPIVP